MHTSIIALIFHPHLAPPFMQCVLRNTLSRAPCRPPLQMLLVVAALALCVALSMFVADKYLTNTGYALESNSSDEDNIECV